MIISWNQGLNIFGHHSEKCYFFVDYKWLILVANWHPERSSKCWCHHLILLSLLYSPFTISRFCWSRMSVYIVHCHIPSSVSGTRKALNICLVGLNWLSWQWRSKSSSLSPSLTPLLTHPLPLVVGNPMLCHSWQAVKSNSVTAPTFSRWDCHNVLG